MKVGLACLLSTIVHEAQDSHMLNPYHTIFASINGAKFSPGLSSGVAGDKRAGLDCTDCTEGVGLTVGSGCSMGDRYCLQ